MRNYKNILIIFIISCAVGTGIFVSDLKKQAEASQCYYPFMLIDKMDEVYNHAVCQGNFQVYYFPVVTDGREYTITLHSIEGEQKLYASRYKNKVDNLGPILNWYCSSPSCDSATEINTTTKIVTFESPVGDEPYYSWFAVYGENASRYQIGVSNNGVLQFVISSNTNNNEGVGGSGGYSDDSNSSSSDNYTNQLPQIFWKANTPTPTLNIADTFWTSISYNDSGWNNLEAPDRGNWGCDNCYRQYRGTFNLNSVPTDLKMKLVSDDGAWLYVNGQLIGQWGSDNPNKMQCVNHYGCTLKENIADIKLTNLVEGKNVISVIVVDGGDREYFDLQLKK